MTKRVWFLGHYAAFPTKDGWSGTHLSLAKELNTLGWETTIISAGTGHPSGKQAIEGLQLRQRGIENGIRYIWLRATSYSGNGFRRILNMLSFTALVLCPFTFSGIPRPDIIIGRTVHPLAAWSASRLARRWEIPFVFEVGDLWPETLIGLNKVKRNSIIAKLLRMLERGLVRSSAFVMSPLPGVGAYLRENGFGDKMFVWISNGIDAEQQLPNVPPPSRLDGFEYMYLGAHGNANAVEGILSAFDRHSAGNDARGEPILRLVGDGPKKTELRSYANSLASRDRIFFEERIPREDVIKRAQEADCLIANMYDLPLYRYGIGLNKIFDYLLASRPIIFAASSLNDPVDEANAGISVPGNDVGAMAKAMSSIEALDVEQRCAMGRRGRAYVLTNYSYQSLAHRLHEHLIEVVGR